MAGVQGRDDGLALEYKLSGLTEWETIVGIRD